MHKDPQWEMYDIPTLLDACQHAANYYNSIQFDFDLTQLSGEAASYL